MALTGLIGFVAGLKAKASELNANFQKIAAKFAQGITSADCSSTAGFTGSQISSAPGTRITNVNLENACVDGRVLKADANAGSPNAAVNDPGHIKDGLITGSKLKLVRSTYAIPNGTTPTGSGGGQSYQFAGTLFTAALPLITAMTPLMVYLSKLGAVSQHTQATLVANATTGAVGVNVAVPLRIVPVTGVDSPLANLDGFTINVIYLQ